MKDKTKLFLMIGGFLALYFLPLETPRAGAAAGEALAMAVDYARHHFLFAMLPAFFIAGALESFIARGSVMRYLGAEANKFLAYGVASVSGAVLAVCSCTVMPIFSGIYRRGAGIGPATTFLYSGPAISVAAIIITAVILGPELGIARAVGAILFSIIIGLTMSGLFKKEDKERLAGALTTADAETTHRRKPWQDGLFFFTMIAFLVLLNWHRPEGNGDGIGYWLHDHRFWLAGGALLMLGIELLRWFKKDDMKAWGGSTWNLLKQIIPLLLMGVLISGFLFGRPGHEGLIPPEWVNGAVGGNSLLANLVASVLGSVIYFCTLTEVPILQALIGVGMGPGPALALLLAGPAVSLPNLLIIRSVLGTKKTAVYLTLVIILSTAAGYIFGTIFPTLPI